jgi:DNA-binding response OmpR family regulator
MGKKVLIVDDDEDIVKLMKIRLSAKGFEVILGKDGEEGLSLVKSEKPDILLIDFDIPKKSGEEVAKELKGSGLPILILSGAERNLEPGLVNGVILKPYDWDKLLAEIDKLTGS